MFLTSDEQILTVLKMQDTLPIVKFINKKQYRVGDTPLSYRQVNELDKEKLLKDERENEAGWRKFSFKELLFFTVASELKELGVENSMLRPLSKLFFRITRKDGSPHNTLDDVVCSVLAHIQVVLTFNTKGQVIIYAAPYFELIGEREDAFVYVNMNKIIEKLFKKLGKDYDFTYKSTSDSLLDRLHGSLNLTEREQELVQQVRSGEYDRVEVVMKDGKMNVIRGTKVKRNPFTPTDFAKMLADKRYAKITIQMEDGNVVVHEVEEKKKA